MTQKLIQWNCHGYETNYNKLLLFMTELTLLPYASKKSFKKSSDKLNMKTFEQYDYIHDTGLRSSGGVSILMKNVPQSKIKINTYLQSIAVSATLHKTVFICSLYIPPHDPINKKELNNMIKQLPKPFILMVNFNSLKIIYG